MGTIERFEDIPIWNQAREICTLVFKMTGKDGFKRDFELVKQINRSSGSCMDNIAEGFERDGNKEFIYFLSISKGSIGETRSQLYRALDREYISKDEFELLKSLCMNEAKDIGNFIRYLKGSDFRGNKFKEMNKKSEIEK